MDKRDSKSIISLNGLVQKPLSHTSITYELDTAVNGFVTCFALSGLSTIRSGDLLRIDDEYSIVQTVGFGSTPAGPITGIGTWSLVEIERGTVGSAATVHSAGSTARIYRGAFQIVDSDVYFTNAPLGGDLGLIDPSNLPYPRASFGGRTYLRQDYSTNQIFDDNSDQFDGLETISSGQRDDDKEGMEGYSASRMRLAAIEGDFKSFYNNLQQEVPAVDELGEPIYEVDPNTGEQLIDEQGQPIQAIDLVPLLNRKAAKDYFMNVRQAMGVEQVNECWNIWEIAPKDDPENLREAYIKKEIFDIGTKVENVNTGLVGRIIRRGANHLICVSEDQIMFKSWIKDVTESVVNGTTISGVPATQRLDGTDAHLKYVATMVPGSNWGIDFINKYKVRKN